MAFILPEQGQLAEVRRRRFVVTDVRGAAKPSDPSTDGARPGQNLVTLSSVEDDALGEELRVIWEVEPGARVFERMELPEPSGFDDPERLDAFLDAVKWGAVSNADTRHIQSPFRSGVDVEDYQLDPVVRAVQMPRANLLIADDVGLGKTIEAGLVCQELMLRHRARRVLVVCPSALQIQWQEQMRDKFGLEFRVVDSELMKELRRRRGIHVNPWTHFPRLITSIDFLKRDQPLRLFRAALPAEGQPAYPRRFDLLIVDEAHNVAPAGAGRYATDSQRTSAVRLLTPHFEHKLFLTATPHNGYPESFTALLELLDPQRFARGVTPDRKQLEVVMVRRLKGEIVDWDGKPRFPARTLEAIPVAYTEEERQAHASLNRYTQLRRQGAGSAAEKYATEFVLKLLKKRLFSSPEAFRLTLEQHERSLAEARRRVTPGAVATSVPQLRRQIETPLDEDFADDEAFEAASDDAVTGATRLFREPTWEERELLAELRRWASRAAGRPDSKAVELLRWLKEMLKPGGEWGETRVIIFTEYRATQRWLHEQLASEGLASEGRLLTLYGGMDPQERERIKAAFQAGPEVTPVRILLATDAASEGLDLQNHCSHLIHCEIPWNPNRLEQRNGRIDRHGQKAGEVLVYHFVGQGFDRRREVAVARPGDLDGDLEFLMRAALKVDHIREDLGKVGTVIAQQVEQAMLGGRQRLDTDAAERDSERVRNVLKFERQLREQIKRLMEQLQETRQSLRLEPENIEAVVSIGLQLAGQPPLLPVQVEGVAGRSFRLPPLKGSWAACAEGLAHPYTRVMRPIVFDPELARGRDDIVLAHLNHRLVQMCLRLLRAEVWTTGGAGRLRRVTARLIGGSAFDYPIVIAHGRLVVLGGDHQRLHEEVIAAGGLLREGRFNRLNVGQVQAALDAASPDPAPESVRGRLAELWPSHAPALMQALEARMKDRTANLESALSSRAEREAGDITAVLTELRESILRELEEPEESPQLELFTDDEKEQFRRDTVGLRARVAQIPAEIEQEVKIVRARYSNPSPRLFPLAVTYLVPVKLARG